jgi:class 3 adenylate cyclase
MAVAGLPNPRPDHAIAAAHMALEMQTVIQTLSKTTGYPLEMRIGLHSGPVVAGVIGIKKFIYDLWGDTVNVASRMESHGKPGHIHVSDTTHTHLQEHFELIERGNIDVKGKGNMRTFWLKSPICTSEALIQQAQSPASIVQ